MRPTKRIAELERIELTQLGLSPDPLPNEETSFERMVARANAVARYLDEQWEASLSVPELLREHLLDLGLDRASFNFNSNAVCTVLDEGGSYLPFNFVYTGRDSLVAALRINGWLT